MKKNRNFFKFEKKFGWGELISLIALLGLIQVHNDSLNSRALNKLDLEPKLVLNASLQKNNNIPANISIQNIGPLDATQVKVELFVYRLLDSKRLSGMYSSDNSWFFEKLIPNARKSILFDERSLKMQLPGELNQDRAVEILITYRRESDLKEYSGSAFYFLNPDGFWVQENNHSLDLEIYQPIKDAVINRSKDFIDKVEFSDIQHTH